MVNNDQPRQTHVRKRASTPRSKTGCSTCKIRRLKCGEERPGCHRCRKSGWPCDGYHRVNTHSPASDGGLSISPTRSSQNQQFVDCSMLPALTEQEQQLFLKCGKEITGQLQEEEAIFWRSMVSNESVMSQSVRHGLIAVGALKQSTVKKAGRYQMDAVPGCHREIALEHYHKSIQSLREFTPSLEDQNSIRSLLISCMILAIFDDFIGHGGFALQHIHYARQLVLDSNFLLSATTVRRSEDNTKLISMFLRLDVGTLCALGIHEDFQDIPFHGQYSAINLPKRFSSFEEARSLSTYLCSEAWKFFYHSSKFHFLPQTKVPPQVLEFRDHFVQQLYDLCTLLSELKEEKSVVLRHPLARTKSLRLYPIIILIRLFTSFGSPETACDALLDHFKYLVDFSREIIQYEQVENQDVTRGADSWTPVGGSKQHSSHSVSSVDLTMIAVPETYSTEARTVSPLLLVATKCRHHTLRREAIQLLLASHRREWMQDSFLSGQIGRWVMELEEEGMDSNSFIPEHARVWGESVELELEGRGAKVKCRQNYINQDTGELDWVLRETYFSW